MIHIMVAAQQVKEAMQRLEQIYGKDRMKETATKFPLGQWLLLAPLASDLNKKNLNAFNQLLKKGHLL